MIDFYLKVAELLRSGRRIAVAGIISSKGSTPRKAGAKMIVTMEGESFFSIGGGPFETIVIKEAQELLKQGGTAIRKYSFHEGEGSVGMTCGGDAEVLIETLHPPEKLIIFGAGHIGGFLAEMARRAGFEVFLVDDRKEMRASVEKTPSIHFILTDRSYSTDLPGMDDRSYVVIVTRCHETDRASLLSVINRNVPYIGMIGSKRKREELFKKVVSEDGVAPDLLKNVKCPVGLDIGSETPEEIAVSILAEIISVKRKAAAAGK